MFKSTLAAVRSGRRTTTFANATWDLNATLGTYTRKSRKRFGMKGCVGTANAIEIARLHGAQMIGVGGRIPRLQCLSQWQSVCTQE